MPLKSLLALSTILLCAGSIGCSVHVSFAPRNQPEASPLAQRSSQDDNSANSASREKKSRFAFLNFNRNQQKRLDTKPLQQFLVKKQQPSPLIEPNHVAVPQIKPEATSRPKPESYNRLVGYSSQEQIREPNRLVQQARGTALSIPTGEQASSSIENTPFGSSTYPIDLPTTLRLAGADNWNVLLAMEQINEAYAKHEKAKVMWVPSLNVGIGYTKHDGQIQATNGQVVDVSRNSLFVGGGAASSSSFPLTGGAGGPARLAVGISLTDAIFSPLAECQLYNASRSRHSAAFNNALLEASLGYYSLMKAQGELAIAKKNLQDAQELLNMTSAFVEAGKGSRADVSRAAVEVSNRRQAIVNAELAMKIASTDLVRVLQLDPEQIGTETLLVALEEQPLPVMLIQEGASLDELISQGHNNRPELSEQASRMEASRIRARAEQWRPYLPNLHMGTSVGAFGGGLNGDLNQLDGRSDIDLLAVWQIENLGLGTRARRRQMNSQYRQDVITTNRTFDIVSADVTNAWNSVRAQQQQIQLAEENINRATESYNQNIGRIRGLAGLPLEGVQALSAVADARQAYLNAIIAYNQSQLNLLRAIGRPPGMTE